MTKVATVVRIDRTRHSAEVVDLHAAREDRYRGFVHEARNLMLEGEEEAALEQCYAAIRVRPDGYEGLALAGTLLAMIGEPERSIAYTREAIRVSPDRPDAYYDLASTLLETGRADEALPFLERGTRLLGDRRDDLVDFLYSARVEALTELARFEEAREVLAEGRRRCEDAMALLAGAEELLEERTRERPALRLV